MNKTIFDNARSHVFKIKLVVFFVIGKKSTCENTHQNKPNDGHANASLVKRIRYSNHTGPYNAIYKVKTCSGHARIREYFEEALVGL